MPAGGKTRLTSPQEWEERRGDARPTEWSESPPEWGERREGVRPTEWQENAEGTARGCKGEPSFYRALTSPEWVSCPGGTKPSEWPPRERDYWGRTDEGRKGTEPPPPPKQPRRSEPEAATRNAVDFVAPLDGGSEVCVQFL